MEYDCHLRDKSSDISLIKPQYFDCESIAYIKKNNRFKER